jgi:predicted amidophosphoribosyltransferase
MAYIYSDKAAAEYPVGYLHTYFCLNCQKRTNTTGRFCDDCYGKLIAGKKDAGNDGEHHKNSS